MPDTTQQPNLLVIMSDQHRAGVMGCAGDPWAHTPHLDRLASQSVRFPNAYCNSPICVPSRMSFLTGRMPGELEVWSLSDTMRSDELTWPTLLGAAGYDTAIAGRMHMWWPDKLHGFHQRLCGDTSDHVAEVSYELFEPRPGDETHHAPFVQSYRNELNASAVGQGPHPGMERDREATRRAVQFLQQRPSNGAAPFALCVGYLCPHSPLRMDSQYFDRFRDMPVEVEALDPALPPMVQAFARALGLTDRPLEPQVVAQAVRAYYALVSFLDEQVGELLQALEQAGHAKNTVVVYTSDHGEMLGSRGLWYKNQLLEPAIRVPLLVRSGQRCGQVEPALVSLVDLFPTFGQLAGAPPWEPTAGRSLAPLLQDDAPRPGGEPAAVLVEYADFGIGQPAACLRQGHLKLIAARHFRSVLYDLQRDPGETTDRYDDPQYSTALGQLEQMLARRWDPQATYRRVVRNQRRIDLVRTSRRLQRQRQSAVAADR